MSHAIHCRRETCTPYFWSVHRSGRRRLARRRGRSGITNNNNRMPARQLVIPVGATWNPRGRDWFRIGMSIGLCHMNVPLPFEPHTPTGLSHQHHHLDDPRTTPQGRLFGLRRTKRPKGWARILFRRCGRHIVAVRTPYIAVQTEGRPSHHRLHSNLCLHLSPPPHITDRCGDRRLVHLQLATLL